MKIIAHFKMYPSAPSHDFFSPTKMFIKSAPYLYQKSGNQASNTMLFVDALMLADDAY